MVAVLAGAADCADAADLARAVARTPISVALTDCVAAVVPAAVAGGISLAGRLVLLGGGNEVLLGDRGRAEGLQAGGQRGDLLAEQHLDVPGRQ